MTKKTLIGPFSQMLTMEGLPLNGPLSDKRLRIVENGGIVLEAHKIIQVLDQSAFETTISDSAVYDMISIAEDSVLIPGLVDSHTHICYGGSRADDYARRLRGESYLEIAKKGGGILSTVTKTREASEELLKQKLIDRAKTHIKRGITTCEVKSGYGLSLESELKMLRVINQLSQNEKLPELIPTCLSAHVKPKEFEKHPDYLNFILKEILPRIKAEQLSQRVDIFVEEETFAAEMSIGFANQAKTMGFDIIIHADQFSSGGSKVAAAVSAISADHLEASADEDLEHLKTANVIATVLPGASMGLGVSYAPARKILDKGLSLVIASDWNPGSAPMGDLLMQASVLGVFEKLTLCETLAGISVRAANALNLNDRGTLTPGAKADMIAFPCNNYREIFYNQGSLKPKQIWKNGQLID